MELQLFHYMRVGFEIQSAVVNVYKNVVSENSVDTTLAETLCVLSSFDDWCLFPRRILLVICELIPRFQDMCFLE